MTEPEQPSRRTFLGLGLAVVTVPLLIACESSGDGAPADGPITAPLPAPLPDAFVIDGPDVVVTVARVPALAVLDAAAVLLAARVIVVRTGAAAFSAFSVECPHAGCAVSIVNGARLICPCHASAFDLRGQRLEGPAPTGLTALSTVYDPMTNLLRVRRTV